jgi:hypothetical protein
VSKQINHQISISVSFHCQVVSLENAIFATFPSQKSETWQNRVRVSGVDAGRGDAVEPSECAFERVS